MTSCIVFAVLLLASLGQAANIVLVRAGKNFEDIATLQIEEPVHVCPAKYPDGISLRCGGSGVNAPVGMSTNDGPMRWEGRAPFHIAGDYDWGYLRRVLPWTGYKAVCASDKKCRVTIKCTYTTATGRRSSIARPLVIAASGCDNTISNVSLPKSNVSMPLSTPLTKTNVSNLVPSDPMPVTNVSKVDPMPKTNTSKPELIPAPKLKKPFSICSFPFDEEPSEAIVLTARGTSLVYGEPGPEYSMYGTPESIACANNNSNAKEAVAEFIRYGMRKCGIMETNHCATSSDGSCVCSGNRSQLFDCGVGADPSDTSMEANFYSVYYPCKVLEHGPPIPARLSTKIAES